MRRVIVTRPAERAEDLAAELAAAGIEAVIAPMLTVEPLEADGVLSPGVQAALVTSGNGARGLARLTERRDVPVLAVGDATAGIARAAGFTEVETASGDADALVALVVRRCDPALGPLVWVSGEAVSTDIVPVLAARGFRVERRVVYRTAAAEALPAAVAEALRAGAVDGAMFFSSRSAEVFIGLVRGRGLETACGRLSAYCMSDTIAQTASQLPWNAIHVAGEPTKAALLDAVIGGGRRPRVTED